MSKEDLKLFLDIYRENPCQVLPNAFWKTAKELGQSHLSVARDSNEALTFLAVQDNERILSCWCRTPEKISRHISVEDISFALVHEYCLKMFNGGNFVKKTAYFRLQHRGAPPNYHCPFGYQFEAVNPQDDLPRVVSFINQCYENIRVDEKIVQSWLDHPVYDPNLWIWIKDSLTSQHAALGIAEIDKRVPEASLEWIQVHPECQGKGLGSALVAELLRRVAPDVELTTVSGEVDNPSDPEKLYRKVGFTGSDVWWLLKA